MSAIALQRVVVRMLFDTAFRDQVYAAPIAVLHDVDLTPEERQWLIAPDPRAYGTDGYRQSRALTGLLEEYPVVGALAMRCPQGAQRLHAFFTAECFHQCVQQRGSLADAFGSYVGSQTFADCPEMAHLAQVERSIARARRASYLASDREQSLAAETCLILAPWVELLSVPATTLERYRRLHKHLQQCSATLLQAVLNPAYRLPDGPSLHRQPAAFVLVVGTPGADGLALEAASHELGTLLETARAGVLCRDLCVVAMRLGAEAPEALEIVQGCVTDQLLVQV